MTGKRLREKFGRYRILRLLGEGGMGVVYLARDEPLDRNVALKVPQLGNGDGSQVLPRFYQEARAAASVQHPNICPIFDFGEINGIPYFTMAFIEGKPLADFVHAGKALTPRQTAALVRKVALALHEAHRKGVIHRDLKPANIMINRLGEPVVMDFGLARRSHAKDPRLTQTGVMMGSPAYMPPEQVQGKIEAMGPAWDIYSLGVVLYELLTQRLPFAGEPMAILAQILVDEPPPPSALRPGLDAALDAICRKAMAKKIDNRYGSMAELAADLERYLRGANTEALSASPVAPSAARVPAGDGIRVSRLGGQRSMALAYRLEATPPMDAPPPVRRRRRKRSRRLPWPWLVGGISSAAVLCVVGVVLMFPGKPPVSGGAERPAPGEAEQPARGEFGLPPLSPRPLGDEKGRANNQKPTSPRPQFQPLFNGRDLSAWVVDSGDRNAWRVENGELVFNVANPGQRGWLITKRDYTNFILKLEFQLSPGANSGVALRRSPGAAADKGLEVQIQDDSSPKYRGQKLTERTGTLFGLTGVPAMLLPVGSWNSLEIRMRGWWVGARVNGRQTVDQALDVADLTAHFGEAPSVSGRIGLQHWVGSARFRNIQIQELPAAGLD